MYSTSPSPDTTPSPIYPQRRLQPEDKGKAPLRYPQPLTSSPMERIVQPIRTVMAPDTYIHPQPRRAGPSRLPDPGPSCPPHLLPPHVAQGQPGPSQLQPPAEIYSHRPINTLDALAPADPWGPYARTPTPREDGAPPCFVQPATFTPAPAFTPQPADPQFTAAAPALLQLPNLNIVSAGPLPAQAAFSMPTDPINRQHGPNVPDSLLGHIDRVDNVEDMNAPFPFMFAQERACGSVSPVFVSQNGHMHYYAWGDYRNVAMLTMTVPVHRLQQLRLNMDALDRDDVPSSDPPPAPTHAKRGRPYATTGAMRKRKSRAKANKTP